MLEHLVRLSIGYYFRERITNPKNLINRDNQQERLELCSRILRDYTPDSKILKDFVEDIVRTL